MASHPTKEPDQEEAELPTITRRHVGNIIDFSNFDLENRTGISFFEEFPEFKAAFNESNAPWLLGRLRLICDGGNIDLSVPYDISPDMTTWLARMSPGLVSKPND